jgi:hypothetical protein
MSGVELGCLPTMIGSMPQTDGESACRQVFEHLKEIPAWPQLPRRSYLENMYVQYSQGFPGVVVGRDRIMVDRNLDLDGMLEKLYSAYLDNDYSRYPITGDYAEGLKYFLTYTGKSVRAVKGQITGPVSWGMTVADNNGKAVAYDDVLADAAAKLLKLRATWMEKELQKISRHTLIFLDEPYLHSIGSAFFTLSREKVVSLIGEVFSGIEGLKGIHCCGNTDWSVVLSTGLDILSFDTYNYAASLPLYNQDVKRFINRGGVIAWGVVPNEAPNLAKETVSTLLERLEEAIAPFTRQGTEIPFRQMITQGLLTPSCTLASLTPEAAGQALALLVDLSTRVRSKYG